MMTEPSRALRILLVEDDAGVREVLTQMLASLGHSVLAAAGGREGLARLEAGDFVDLVVTDLKMPGMTGWDVVKTVKAKWPHLRIGIVTGTPELLRERREPVDLVIEKPVRLEALRQAITRIQVTRGQEGSRP